MKHLRSRAKIYILAVIIGGLAVITWQGLNIGAIIGSKSVLFLGIATVLAALAHFKSVQGSTPKSSYDLALLIYGFVLVIQGPQAAIITSAVACLLDWAWHKPPWFIQAFNICSLAVALTAAGAVYHLTSVDGRPSGPLGAVGVLGAVLIFVGLNHLLVGFAVGFASGERLTESGIFSGLTLSIDAALAAAGTAAAVIWFVDPYVCLVTLIPVYVISMTLKMPELERQAISDPKTGVFNARHFQELLETELMRANRFNRPLTVVMGDLDLLRNVNNVYGHLAGDQVLIRVAQILKDSVRDYDIVARFGGEEFTILLPETSAEQALPRIEALRQAIAEADIEVITSAEPIRTTMSFGLAQRESAADSPEDIVHRADLAVYKAKFDGRNCVHAVTLDPDEDHGDEVEWKPVARPGVVKEPVFLPSTLPRKATSTQQTRPRLSALWPQRLLITVVGLVSAGALAATLVVDAKISVDFVGLAVLALIALMTEALAIEIYVRDTTISTSAAALTAGAILFGPIAALVIGGLIAIAAMMRHHCSFSRLVFNGGTQVLAGLGCVWIIRLVGHEPAREAPWLVLGVSVMATLLVYAVTTGLVAAASHLDSREGFKKTWVQHFSWLAPYYFGLGALACGLVLGFVYAGVVGVAGLIVPLLLLRFGQKQYIKHTAALVSRLRTANSELKERTEDVSALNDELLLLLSGTLDLRDPHALGHSRYVARYAGAIGRELGLTAAQQELLRRAALLHDIGKLALPDAILAKNGPLTEVEFDTVKAHPGTGARIFVDSRFLQGILPIIRHHHERYDGGGYPSGLKGAAIPLEARILSVADAVEAMASDRSYRLGAPNEIVLRELRQNAGAQFDPTVVDAFCRTVAKRACSIVNSSDAVREPGGEHRIPKGVKRVRSPSDVEVAR